MKKTLITTGLLVLLLTVNASAGIHHVFDDFVITQYNATAGNSTVTNLLKPAPEIAFFEDAGDINLFQFLEHNPYATYTKELSTEGLTGGAADILNIVSNNSFHFTGDAPGTMILNSYDGSRNIFDPLFSNYVSLVFDVKNIGSNGINILPRIGPNSVNSNLSMYYAFDENYNPVNVKALAAGDSATFIFGLGLDPSTDPSVVWDYAQDPNSQFELLFQPEQGTIGFDVLVDNIGFAMGTTAVAEPGSLLLFAFGFAFIKRIKRNK